MAPRSRPDTNMTLRESVRTCWFRLGNWGAGFCAGESWTCGGRSVSRTTGARTLLMKCVNMTVGGDE